MRGLFSGLRGIYLDGRGLVGAALRCAVLALVLCVAVLQRGLIIRLAATPIIGVTT
jgi:hypothetical protein